VRDVTCAWTVFGPSNPAWLVSVLRGFSNSQPNTIPSRKIPTMGDDDGRRELSRIWARARSLAHLIKHFLILPPPSRLDPLHLIRALAHMTLHPQTLLSRHSRERREQLVRARRDEPRGDNGLDEAAVWRERRGEEGDAVEVGVQGGEGGGGAGFAVRRALGA
jgi:hypothetical protein